MPKIATKIYLTATILIAANVGITAAAYAWKPPSAEVLQAVRENCLAKIGDLESSAAPEQWHGFEDNGATRAFVRCFVYDLGLWSDKRGHSAKRLVKLFKKHEMPVEIAMVVDFCNESQRHEDVEQWAFNAYKCMMDGTMGDWLAEYVKGVYSQKGNK